MTKVESLPISIEQWKARRSALRFSWDDADRLAPIANNISVKDFWRKKPNGEQYTDSDLRNMGHIVDVPGRGLYHLAYVLPEWYETLESPENGLLNPADMLVEIWREKASIINTMRMSNFEGVIFKGSYQEVFGSNTESLFKLSIFMDDTKFFSNYGNVIFTDCVFLSNISFSTNEASTLSGGSFVFKECDIYGTINFEECRCASGINFENSELRNTISITNSNLLGQVKFEDSIFYNPFFVDSSLFNCGIKISFCSFKSHFSIQDVDFKGKVSIVDTEFCSDFELVASRFFDQTRFADVGWPSVDGSCARAQETKFIAEVAFSGNEPPPVQLFDDLRFESVASFPRCADAAWLRRFDGELMILRKREKDGGAVEVSMEQLESGCRTLRKLADISGNIHLEHQWHRCELVSRRNRSDVPLLEKSLSRLYGIVGDYGLSISRPFVVLAVVIIFFSVIYAFCMRPPRFDGSVDWVGIRHSLGYSLNRTFPIGVFDVSDSNWRGELIGNAGTWSSLVIRFIATIQTIMSVILIYLGVMAARRKFKIS